MLPGGFSMPDLDAEQLGKLINDLFKTAAGDQYQTVFEKLWRSPIIRTAMAKNHAVVRFIGLRGLAETRTRERMHGLFGRLPKKQVCGRITSDINPCMM